MKTNLLTWLRSRLPLSLAAILMAASLQVSAQNRGRRADAPNAERRTEFAKAQAAEIAKELGLNDADAARFTTVYLNYQDEMWKSRPKARPKKGMTPDNVTEQQAQEYNREWLRHERDFCDVKERYYNECCKFLNQRQIFKANHLERKAFERMMQHHGNNGNNPHHRATSHSNSQKTN